MLKPEAQEQDKLLNVINTLDISQVEEFANWIEFSIFKNTSYYSIITGERGFSLSYTISASYSLDSNVIEETNPENYNSIFNLKINLKEPKYKRLFLNKKGNLIEHRIEDKGVREKFKALLFKDILLKMNNYLKKQYEFVFSDKNMMSLLVLQRISLDTFLKLPLDVKIKHTTNHLSSVVGQYNTKYPQALKLIAQIKDWDLINALPEKFRFDVLYFNDLYKDINPRVFFETQQKHLEYAAIFGTEKCQVEAILCYPITSIHRNLERLVRCQERFGNGKIYRTNPVNKVSMYQLFTLVNKEIQTEKDL